MLNNVLLAVLAAGMCGCSFNTSATRASDAVSDEAPADLPRLTDLAPPDLPQQDAAPDLPQQDAASDLPQQDAAPDLPQQDLAAVDAPADLVWPDLVPPPDTLDPLAPFSTPQSITALNSSLDEDDPTLTGDMLEIYFDRDHNIYRSTRSSATGAWSTPQAVAALNSSDNETTPGITPDGLAIFVASNRSGGLGLYDLWSSTRTTRNDPWSTPQLVSTINSVESESGPCPAADLLTITFSSRIAGDTDLYQSTRASTSAAWGTPVPLSPLNSPDGDGDPWLVGYLLVFGSTRPGMGGYDLWISLRSGASYTAPVAIGSLNSSDDETDPWLSPDLRTIVFASDRTGDWDLYVATR